MTLTIIYIQKNVFTTNQNNYDKPALNGLEGLSHVKDRWVSGVGKRSRYHYPESKVSLDT